MKRTEVDGKFYRIRDGKRVEIPEKWVGKVTHPQTISKRKSKKNRGKSFRIKAIGKRV